MGNAKVVAVDPDPKHSEKIGIVLDDVSSDADFADRWTREDHEMQREFGFDLPLHGEHFSGFMPRRKRHLTYSGYVALVDAYMKAQVPSQAPKASGSVSENVALFWEVEAGMHSEILGIEADSVVGEAVVAICKRAEALLAYKPSDTAKEVECAWETSTRSLIMQGVVEQAAIWYFG